jgi:GNAT superfamily N-acetyltransferase
MLIKDKFDWSIRKMRSSDLEALMQIKNAENWNQTEGDWLFLIRSNPEYCLVAVLEDKVIGTITAINYDQRAVWIGMMLVSKKYRGLGISKKLLNTIIKDLAKCDSIKLDATPAGIPVYKKLGFIAEYDIHRMVCSRLAVETMDREDTGSLEISNILPGDLNSLVQLDETVFGLKRQELFQFLLDSKKEIGFQIKEGNHLKGFILGREGSNYLQIGPLIAESLQIAKWLLNSVFKKAKQNSLVIDILTDKGELKDWLLFKDFKYERSFTRMYLKSNDYSIKKENQFLIGGPELG